MLRSNIYTVLFVILPLLASSQKLPVSFGDISHEDLRMNTYKHDKSASAVVLSDIGHAEIQYNGDNFQIVFERNVRVKILNKNGFDYANVEIPYYANDKLLKVQASTYNLVNDTIVETKVDKEDFISDKTTKYVRKMLIAFPYISEGSVIEYQYRYITNQIYRLIPWEFQSEIPTIYSDFTAEYVDFFNYRGLIKGDASIITRRDDSKSTFIAGYTATASVYRWVGSNIPAFKEEPFITGVSDYLTRLEFELVGVNFPDGSYREFTPTYKDLSKKLLERSDFGVAIQKTSFLNEYTQKVISSASNDLEKLKAIRSFVANRILWDGTNDFTSSGTLKSVFQEERGNSADVNMILIAMLRQAGIKADPVVLSTRSNGGLSQIIAMLQQFNYVLAYVTIGNETYLVDATEPLLPYNILPFRCLNNKGWLVSQSSSKWVNLSNNEKNVSIFTADISLNLDGDVTGVINNSYLGYLALARRNDVKMKSKKGYLDDIMLSNPNWCISEFEFENIDSLSSSFNEKYNLVVPKGAQTFPGGLILNPYMISSNLENPFVSDERRFSIDFGCPNMNIFTIRIKIPEGYEIDEKPESISVKLPDNAGSFLYTCEQQGDLLTVQSRFVIDKVHFKPEEYVLLREFFAQTQRKQSELIVFKKKEI